MLRLAGRTSADARLSRAQPDAVIPIEKSGCAARVDVRFSTAARSRKSVL